MEKRNSAKPAHSSTAGAAILTTRPALRLTAHASVVSKQIQLHTVNSRHMAKSVKVVTSEFTFAAKSDGLTSLTLAVPGLVLDQPLGIA